MTFCELFLWISVSALLTISGPLALDVEGQTDQVVNLSVDDPRPVAKAMEILEAKYGWVITYEDPRYVHESDIMDVAYKVRKDLHQYPPGKAPPVLVPKGGQININYILNSQTGKPDNPVQLIQQILDDHAARGNPGVFRLIQTGQIFHLVPAMVKNSQGQWVKQASILDAVITFPEEERTDMELLNEIFAAVSRLTRIEVMCCGGLVVKRWLQHRSRRGAANEPARDVLVRSGLMRSWRLFYGPGERSYALNPVF